MEPLVSVCCITYNHEKYITEAIESFLMQETDFPFEIIIHDDASTDKTANIIKEYELKYPDIIKPIYQTENQYSKGKRITFEYVFPKVTGKYIAFCEGDDYWIDKNKLQKQVDFMEKNSEFSMCFHAVKGVDTAGNFSGRYLGPYKDGNRIYTLKDNIKGGFTHLSSIVMRSKLIENGMPSWAFYSRHGDYALTLFLSANGKTFFIDRIMSHHRYGVEGSLMTEMKKNYSVDSDINYQIQRIETLEMADKYYSYKYHDEIEIVNLISKVIILLLESDYSSTARRMYKKYVNQHGLISFIKIFLLKKCPTLAKLLVKIKDIISITRMNGELDGP